MWFVLLTLNLWAAAALYIDCRIATLRLPAVLLYVVLVLLILVKSPRAKIPACFTVVGLVLLWWFSLRPSNAGNWQENVSRTAWAEIDGNRLTIHNLRNCDYRTETEYSDCWSDRTFDLSNLRGADFFFVNWGIRWIGHPIVSFGFGDNHHLAFSIEARYKVGQTYSSLLGFFRQYELIFVASDERDVIRLRTNYRKDEEVFLYRTNLPPPIARKVLMSYLKQLNSLKERPQWYNALTKNCTTAINSDISEDLPDPKPWTYRLLLNGTLDQLLYERGRLVTGGLPFPELKARAHINPFAHTVDQSPDFSRLIRIGQVGFGTFSDR